MNRCLAAIVFIISLAVVTIAQADSQSQSREGDQLSADRRKHELYPLLLRKPKGWFAAGAEIEKALTLLSDGAFKLFVYLRLNARRDTGGLTQLARSLRIR
jgi:hypothetical protein